MRTLRTSVRRLVEFLLRSGDIDSEGDWHAGIEAMQAGSEIHRTLQAAAGAAYQAEVPLACSVYFPHGSFSPHAARLDIPEEAVDGQDGFFLRLEGRADGIIDDGSSPLVIDEIKGVSRDVSALDGPAAIHEAQALCYAYLHLRGARGASALSYAFDRKVTVRLTYASMTTGEVRQMERTHDIPDIEAWFFSLLAKAERWCAWRVDHEGRRGQSLSRLAFPLTARPGQKKLMDAVASAIRGGRRLYAQAPTGSGKTIATLFPALKAMGQGEVTRIAYLTAKGMTRKAALECLELLRRQDLAVNVLVVTARDKICPLRRDPRDEQVRARPLASLCNSLECPLARGHYDAVNDALFEAIATQDVLDLAHVEEVAARHHVCPYELQRDAARWSDVIICDYHYAFSPSAALLGLASEPGESIVFLVDEAHNLVERMRDMYSSELGISDLKGLERLLGTQAGHDRLTAALRATIAAFPAWDKALPRGTGQGSPRSGNRPSYQRLRMDDVPTEQLEALAAAIEPSLEQFFSSDGVATGQVHETPRGQSAELFLALRDMNLKVRSFLAALQRSEAGYVTFLGRADNGGRSIQVSCVDPSHDLEDRLEQAKAAVFFSGTLLPMDYHRKLLAAGEDDASLDVETNFDPTRQKILVGSDVSARFSRRGPELYARIGAYIAALIAARPGNYLAFLPSYAMMEETAGVLEPLLGGHATLMRQRPRMREDERERFVERFRRPRGAGTSLVGLCVLGGVFGESIDLPGEALVGVVVVGTGMPRASVEREVIKDYFDARQGQGFAFAYTYPGMIKVLQATGRLIRTEQDRGVALLLDDRFLESDLRKAFPKEWRDVATCTLETLSALLASP